MDVVEYVPAILKEVAGLLAEKELRLRFPLEELDVLLEPEEMEEDAAEAVGEQAIDDGKSAHDSEEEQNFSDDFNSDEEEDNDGPQEEEVDPSLD